MERMPMRAPLARGVMLGLCIAGLVGCGGGGGGGNVRNDPPPPAPSTPTPPVTNPPVTPPVTPPVDPPPPVTPDPPVTPPVTPPVDPAPVTPPIPADAHLHATGVDLVRRYNSFNGDGTTIVFVDSGVNFAHPSLDDDASRSSAWTGLTVS